jgi:S-ribosylhomocysteine lyase LuxS involved in autoinducer biosynthesis
MQNIEIRNAESAAKLAFAVHHSFQVGDILKEIGSDTGYSVMVIGTVDSNEVYDVMVMKEAASEHRVPGAVIGAIIKNHLFPSTSWERV